MYFEIVFVSTHLPWAVAYTNAVMAGWITAAMSLFQQVRLVGTYGFCPQQWLTCWQTPVIAGSLLLTFLHSLYIYVHVYTKTLTTTQCFPFPVYIQVGLFN